MIKRMHYPMFANSPRLTYASRGQRACSSGPIRNPQSAIRSLPSATASPSSNS